MPHKSGTTAGVTKTPAEMTAGKASYMPAGFTTSGTETGTRRPRPRPRNDRGWTKGNHEPRPRNDRGWTRTITAGTATGSADKTAGGTISFRTCEEGLMPAVKFALTSNPG